MSRSKRKPWVTDGYGTKWKHRAKTYHNRKVRRKLKNSEYELPDGGAHKHGPGLNSWDICDFKWYIPKPLADRIEYGYIETLEEQLTYYLKSCRK